MRFILAALVILGGTGSVHAQDCAEIRFPRGANGTTISGTIPPDQILCYRLDVAVGQEAELSITGSRDDIAFTIDDEVDNRSAWSYVTKQPRYLIRVYTTFRSATAESFDLRIRVD